MQYSKYSFKKKNFLKNKALISLIEMDFISVFDMKEQVQVLDPAIKVCEDACIIGFEGSFGSKIPELAR